MKRKLFIPFVLLVTSITLLLSHFGFPSAAQVKSRSSSSEIGAANPFNSLIAIQVASNGRFNMGAFPNSTGGAGPNSFDLMYRWPEGPHTSFTTLRIDGVDSIYGSSGTQIESPTDIDAKTNRSKWRIGNVEVTQILQLTLNSQSGREDVAKISYIVRNLGSASHNVGLRAMLDTEINENDGVPFRVPGVGIVRKEMEFTGSAVPDTFQAFFDVTDSQRVSVSTLKSGGATTPDRLVLASWPRIGSPDRTGDYDYTINPNLDFTPDSAYAVYWNPKALAPGESRTYTTFYGLAKLDVNLQPPLALNVSGPSVLSVVGSQYSPNPFDVVATVFNNGTAAATNVRLSLNLPTGLSLATGSATQSLGDLAVGQERQVSWSVLAAPQTSASTGTYSVTAVASNAQAKTIDRQIVVPSLPTTRLSIEIIDPACNSFDRNSRSICPGTYLEYRFRPREPASIGLSSDPDRLAVADVRRDGAATDGVTKLLLRVSSETPVTFSLKKDNGTSAGSEWGTLTTRLGVSSSGNSVTVTPEATRARGKLAFAIYQAPLDFPDESSLFSTSVNIEVTSSSGRGSKILLLRRPPIVLVHGVWSDGTAWQGLENYLRLRGFDICDGCRPDYGRQQPAGSFDPFAPNEDDQFVVKQLVIATRNALNSFRDTDSGQFSFAVTQVDVIGHSMGGLVARSRVKYANPSYPYYRKDNYNQGDLHKIITVGTPHRGSSLADWLIEHKCDILTLGRNDTIENKLANGVYVSFHRPIGPAIYGFQTSSDAIKNIGTTYVPSHAIVGIAPDSSDSEDNLNRIFRNSGSNSSHDNNKNTTIDGLLGRNGNHDIIVPIESQRGGLTTGSTATEVPGIVHANAEAIKSDTNEHDSEDVWKRVEKLLRTEARSSTFSFFAALDPTGTPRQPYTCQTQSLSEEAATLASAVRPQVQAATVTITPSPGTIVRPGDLIQITFAVTGGNLVEGALFSIGRLLHSIDGSGPFSFSFRVPSGRAGRLDISAGTFGRGPDNYEASTYVTVIPASPPLSLKAAPNNLHLENIGESFQIRVTGQFPDATQIDLTSSDAGTRYSLQSGANSVVSVSSDGLVEARGAGQGTILISNSGKTTALTVTVSLDNPIPIITSLNPSSARAGGAAFTLTINGTNFISDSVVSWNGGPRPTTFVSSAQLTASITDADIAAVGTAKVIVFNPGPGGGGTMAGFTVTPPTADLAIAMTASPNLVVTGSIITYMLTVTNSGPGIAGAVVVTDNAPASVNFASCSSTGGGVCGGSGNNRTVSFTSLAPGTSATITLIASVNCALAGGQLISNSATVSSSTPDPNPGNNSATATVNLAPGQAKLSLSNGGSAFDFGTVTINRDPNLSPPSNTFSIENTGCAPLSARFAINRIGADVNNGKITRPDDSATFPISLINNNGAEIPLAFVAGSAQAQINGGQQMRFRIAFSPMIPAPAGGVTNLSAGHVLPPDITSALTIRQDNGIQTTIPLVGRISTAAKMINPLATRLSPLVALARSGSEFVVEFSVFDSNLDCYLAVYQFLDSLGRNVGDALNFDLQQPIMQSGMLKGQSFTTVKRFTGALSRPQVNKVRVTLYDREGNESVLSGEIGKVIGRVVNVSAASFQEAGLASEAITSAFGSNLAASTQAATSSPLPTSLAGTRVFVRDSANVERLAPLFFIAPAQINYQIPRGTSIGPATVTVALNDQAVATATVQVAAAFPGLFAANANGQGVAAAVALRVRADGSQSYEPVSIFDQAQNKFVSRPISLGADNEQVYLVLFGTGIRNRSALSNVTVKIGGVDTPVEYAGSQGGFVGLDQVNLKLPRSLAGRGEVDIVLTVDGKPSNVVKVNLY